jgi:A/G-specific adenine glycosylase
VKHPRAAQAQGKTELVISWAAAHGRDLPWRQTRDPWAILVSEVMAQQTQVARVIPKWFAFLDRWPTAAACASAPLGDVLRLWEGLGYPRRARTLHLAAGEISRLGAFPDTLETLLALPGVGPYTARALLAFAFERDVAVVDTNTARVVARWRGEKLNQRQVQQAADDLVPQGEGWIWNQALLDFGAMVCTLRNPSCAECPLFDMCAYRGIGADPAIGTSGVSVVQSRFAGSDRQLRGQILRLVARTPLDRAGVVVELGHADPDRVLRLIDKLVFEQLLSETQGTLVLGGTDD